MNKLEEYLKNTDTYKRLVSLANYFSKNNVDLSNLFKLQKELVNAKYHQAADLITISKEYEAELQRIKDILFVEEYLELLNEYLDALKYLKDNIERELLLPFKL